METIQNVEETVSYIINLYQKHGNEDYIGEPVSQIEHMCQCAQLAEANDAEVETILAAFFHDIGHLCDIDKPEASLNYMDHYGIVDHEKLGFQFLLDKGFSKNIAKMVGSHVNAKRYLTYKFPDYFNSLSDASKQTLIHQGGQMQESEAILFEFDPLFEKYIALRRWDERAKETNKPLPSLAYYKQMMIAHLEQNSL